VAPATRTWEWGRAWPTVGSATALWREEGEEGEEGEWEGVLGDAMRKPLSVRRVMQRVLPRPLGKSA
jgi:hypothetical protein